MTTCTRCETTGFLNLHEIPEEEMDKLLYSFHFFEDVQKWMAANEEHDVQVCDCR